jgi:ATP adenylyltransferase
VRDDALVVYDGSTAYVMVNRYPYTGGHLMIVPFRHLNSLKETTGEERMEIFSLVDVSVQVLTEAMKPEGFNIGMNLGRAGGAGIDAHLHVHVVPRWSGDTNFTTVIGDIRVVPSDVFATASELRLFFTRFYQGENK